ncbi:MAG: flagellar biosynthetic protein FliO [Chitinispirillaceae bacterium]|nr:flagellar biosynthetic protein FliO [Chitinispirillaceae bacterium]
MLRHWYIGVVTVLLLGGFADAADSDIGDFDIAKVQKAARLNDTAVGETALPAAQRESITAVALRMTLYLGIVIVFILGVAWFIRKSGLRSIRSGGNGAMDVVETLPMGQNRMLVMVRIMDEIYLISQTASAVTLLDKIGGQKALDIISASKGGGTILPFKDAFNNFMGKIKKPA